MGTVAGCEPPGRRAAGERELALPLPAARPRGSRAARSSRGAVCGLLCCVAASLAIHRATCSAGWSAPAMETGILRGGLDLGLRGRGHGLRVDAGSAVVP